MKKILLLAATATSLLSLALPTQAASFNCSKAGNATERAICANNRLGEADVRLDTTYKMLMRFSGYDSAIERDQRAWLRARNECGAKVTCINNEYNLRQRQLERELSAYQGG